MSYIKLLKTYTFSKEHYPGTVVQVADREAKYFAESGIGVPCDRDGYISDEDLEAFRAGRELVEDENPFNPDSYKKVRKRKKSK